MSKPVEQRPPQVSLASGIVMFSSVVVLLSAWQRVTTLTTLDAQEQIRSDLDGGWAGSLGLDVDGVTELLRTASIIAAVAACATLILGWYVRRPDRGSRLGLALFAVPVFVTDLAIESIAGSFVAAGAAMLWMNPAREWFATGRWTPPDPRPEPDPRPDPARRTPTAPPPSGTAQPPTNPYGQAHPGHPVHPVHPSLPGQLPPPPWQQRKVTPARPPALVGAFVVTMVAAGALLSLALLFLGIGAASAEAMLTELERQQPAVVDGLTLSELRRALLGLGAAFFVWSSLALALAGFAMAGRDWARRGLLASALISAVGCLTLVTTAPFVLVPAAAAIATVVCLRRPEVRQWFAMMR